MLFNLKKINRGKFFLFAFILILFLVLFYSCNSNNLRKDAPDFTLTTVNLDHQEISLSQYYGKVIILDFFATWCGPCKAEIPGFVDLYNKYKDKGLVIIGVSMDNSDGPVKNFVKRYKIEYPIVMATHKLIQEYGNIRAVPTTFIIDKHNNIVEKVLGFRRKDFFQEKIIKLLNEK